MGSAWSNPGPARELLVGTPPNPQIVIITNPSTDSGEIDFDYNASDGKLSPASIKASVLNEGLPTEKGVWTLDSGAYTGGTSSQFKTQIGSGFVFADIVAGANDLTMDTLNNTSTLDLTSTDPNAPAVFSQFAATSAGGGTQCQLFAQNNTTSYGVTVNPTGAKFGVGNRGMTYEEIVQLNNGQSIASAAAAVTVLNGFSAVSVLSDYNSGASQFNLATGLWTAPDAGFYVILLAARFNAWVANSNFALGLVRNGTVRTNAFAFKDVSSVEGGQSICAVKKFNAGDTCNFIIRQTTGANQVIGGGEPNQIQIKKVLV